MKSDVDKLDINKFKNVLSNLSNLKIKQDKLDIGKLETNPVHLSKLSSVVINYVVNKTEFNELVKNFNNIDTADTNDLVKTWLLHKNNEIEKKITDHNHEKYITTEQFSKLTADNFTARLPQANLAIKNYFADFRKQVRLMIN